MAAPSAELPPTLRDALSGPRLERRPWSQTVAPAYLSLFIWVAYFDQLPRSTLLVGGLGWSVLGAWVAGLLCDRLLYRAPALWGVATGRPFAVVSTSTFGAGGAAWLPGAPLRAVQVVWFAVAIFYATELTLEALVVCRLLDPSAMQPVVLGGLSLRSPLFLFTSLVWSGTIALAGYYLTRIIAILMSVYSYVLVLTLIAAAALLLPGVAGFRPSGIDPRTAERVANGGFRATVTMIQLVFGFFATAGVSATDWGSACRDARDVGRGGWFCVVLPSALYATLALVIVAGANGIAAARGSGAERGAAIATFTEAVNEELPWPLACAVCFGFGTASLAPACFAAFAFVRSNAVAWPGVWPRRRVWLVVPAAWPLIATGVAARLEDIFSVVGAVVAPLLGALTADYLLSRGRWPGPRPGINPAGWVAWFAGLAVGLWPTLATPLGLAGRLHFQPAAVFAYLAALGIYVVLSKTSVAGVAGVPPAGSRF
jgi:cytosine permease